MAGFVDGEVAGACPSRWQSVQQMQLAGRRIDGECAQVRLVVEVRTERQRVFGRDVEVSLVGMNGKERGVRDFRGKFGPAYFPRCRLETTDIDSLAVASSGRQSLPHIGEAG